MEGFSRMQNFRFQCNILEDIKKNQKTENPSLHQTTTNNTINHPNLKLLCAWPTFLSQQQLQYDL